MACHTCKKNIDGEFLCLNAVAMFLDKTDSSTDVPKGFKVELSVGLTCHSDKHDRYVHTSVLENPQYEFHMKHSEQCEYYFCSKKCLQKWFAEQIKNIPDPSDS